MTAPTRSRTVPPPTRTAAGPVKATRSTTTEREHFPPQPGKSATQPGTTTRRRSQVAERAYARREQRRVDTVRADDALQPKAAGSRVPLVVTVMGLMACGLAATLWLSIAAVSGSYRLQQAQSDVNALTAERDQLLRENSDLDSTPELQRRAAAQGLVPAPQAAYLVPEPDGSVAVLGQPQPADPAAPGR
jgi:hypothetical protein